MPLGIGDVGIRRPLLIDGVELSVMPNDFDFTPESTAELMQLLSGRRRSWSLRPYFDGVPNNHDLFVIAVPYSSLGGADIVKLEEIIARGGDHLVTVWRMRPVIYTCIAGLQRYYLPNGRRCAGHLYAGTVLDGGGAATLTVSTTEFPLIATLDEVALAVTYAEGPTLADPGAGGIVISRQPDASGETADYVPVLMGDVPVGGEELKLWSAWTYECSVRTPRISMRGVTEDHAYTFVEV